MPRLGTGLGIILYLAPALGPSSTCERSGSGVAMKCVPYLHSVSSVRCFVQFTLTLYMTNTIIKVSRSSLHMFAVKKTSRRACGGDLTTKFGS